MKKILLTGASTGIGYKILEILLQNDYEVIACVRKEEDKKRLLLLSQNVQVEILDVVDDVQIKALFEKFKLENIELSAIINNAGIALAGVMEAPDIEAIRYQLEVNTLAPLNIATTFMPLMQEGKIINISSVSSHFVYPFIAPYCVSKRAMDIFFQALSIEMQNPKIKIVSVKPGVIKTPIWEKSTKLAEKEFSKIPPILGIKYNKTLKRMLKAVKISEQRGLEVEAVANLVLKILQTKKTKDSYNLGLGCYIGHFMSKLPSHWQRFLIQKTF